MAIILTILLAIIYFAMAAWMMLAFFGVACSGGGSNLPSAPFLLGGIFLAGLFWPITCLGLGGVAVYSYFKHAAP